MQEVDLRNYYPSWMARAACRDSPLDFHPGSLEAELECLEVCASCPVRVECLRWAAVTEDSWRYGVWGGTTPQDRRRVKPDAAMMLEAGFQKRLVSYRRKVAGIAERRVAGRKKAAQTRRDKKTTAA